MISVAGAANLVAGRDIILARESRPRLAPAVVADLRTAASVLVDEGPQAVRVRLAYLIATRRLGRNLAPAMQDDLRAVRELLLRVGRADRLSAAEVDPEACQEAAERMLRVILIGLADS